MSLTATYNFAALSVGNSITVYDRFQHARVAASEYARRHNVVFTCRVQDDPRCMVITRCESNQANVDKRGARARRRLPVANDPTQVQFSQWLAGFGIGSTYIMPAHYSHLFLAMQAWCELHSLRNACLVTAHMEGGTLLITRLA